MYDESFQPHYFFISYIFFLNLRDSVSLLLLLLIYMNRQTLIGPVHRIHFFGGVLREPVKVNST